MMLGSLRRDPAWLLLALGALVLLGYFLLWPVLSMLASSLFNKEGQFGLHGYVQFFSEPGVSGELVQHPVAGRGCHPVQHGAGGGSGLGGGSLFLSLGRVSGSPAFVDFGYSGCGGGSGLDCGAGQARCAQQLACAVWIRTAISVLLVGPGVCHDVEQLRICLCGGAGGFEIHGSQSGGGRPKLGKLVGAHYAHGDLSLDGARLMWCCGTGVHACDRGLWCACHSGRSYACSGGQDL